MVEPIRRFFSTDGFMPHGHCYLWQPTIVWTMAISDFLIALAYLYISLTLYTLIRKIRLPFTGIFLAFGIFIGACALTHALEVYTLWIPAYWVAALIKVTTAVASVATGLLLHRLFPKIVAMAQESKQSGHRRQELEKAEERFRIVVESVKDYAIFMLEPDGRVATWNDGAKRIKGYEAKEILGQPFSKFYLPEDVRAGKPAHELKQAAENGQFEDEALRIRKDGSPFWANVVITPYRDSSGKIRAFSKVIHDITERKLAEGRLHKAYGELENRVKQRTVELNLALKESKDAVRSRDEFLSIASHELKTPLTSLALQVQMLSSDLEGSGGGHVYSISNPSKFRTSINICKSQSMKLEVLLEELLDLTRVRLGRLVLNKTKLKLSTTVEEVVYKMGTEYGLGNSSLFSLNLDNSVVGYWDPVRVEQIVTNLLSNAIKYGAGKPIRISTCLSPSGEQAILEVEDQGMGISENMHEKIFERFERAISSRNVSGFGLGLYITRQIVEAHGGQIFLRSELEKGSLFTVTLPVGGDS
jgi:PAS domain S-box-containing protein